MISALPQIRYILCHFALQNDPEDVMSVSFDLETAVSPVTVILTDSNGDETSEEVIMKFYLPYTMSV